MKSYQDFFSTNYNNLHQETVLDSEFKIEELISEKSDFKKNIVPRVNH